jgi:hypothetical protein
LFLLTSRFSLKLSGVKPRAASFGQMYERYYGGNLLHAVRCSDRPPPFVIELKVVRSFVKGKVPITTHPPSQGSPFPNLNSGPNYTGSLANGCGSHPSSRGFMVVIGDARSARSAEEVSRVA